MIGTPASTFFMKKKIRSSCHGAVVNESDYEVAPDTKSVGTFFLHFHKEILSKLRITLWYLNQCLVDTLFFFLVFCLFRAILTAYGCSQARGGIGAAAAGHSHTGSELDMLIF